MSIEAMKMALEALEEAASCVQNNYCPDNMGHDWDEQIKALRQAIEQAEKREWVGLTDEDIETIVNNNTYDDSGYDIWCHGKGVARDIQAKLKEKNT